MNDIGGSDLINENDEVILNRLENEETAIIDEVCDYYLQRVGCATADISVVRLAALYSQKIFEKIIGDAKTTNSYNSNDMVSTGKGNTQTSSRELDVETFFNAIKKNDDSLLKYNLDIFLEHPSSALNGQTPNLDEV
ncbi:hypothetical protein IE077_002554 [Cardiosporidium cionae]|uniref:Transcription initiation factor TFIID subunit 10 n=1 Tax=Cardiosporidium cionae TaxID=476202 RepID=A0ABQ7JAL6_9APIC|nr:hypothetical protein IE077_002554 [Cardiosporidium cionae]|eukprot:KAF8821019.1 hypothetical protein IE077_002554 [Cardiosporidium cionae]